MSDGNLASTGFGPGTILVAIIGGILTFCGWVARKIAQEQRADDVPGAWRE